MSIFLARGNLRGRLGNGGGVNAQPHAEEEEGEMWFPLGPKGATSEMNTSVCSDGSVLRNLSHYFLGEAKRIIL